MTEVRFKLNQKEAIATGLIWAVVLGVSGILLSHIPYDKL